MRCSTLEIEFDISIHQGGGPYEYETHLGLIFCSVFFEHELLRLGQPESITARGAVQKFGASSPEFR